MPHVKGHKRGCKCAICSRGKKKGGKRSAKKRGAKKGAKKGATQRKGVGTFLTGFRDGAADVKSGKPMRKAKGKSDYARGYREGARTERGAR